jgi:hypothetical protein
MARPRKLPPEDSLRQLDGQPPPEPGTYPARRARAGIREMRRLTATEAGERLTSFSSEQMDVLDRIAAGERVPGAREVIAAARLKVEFAMARPTQSVDVRQVTYQLVKDPYAESKPLSLPPAVALAALPAPQDDDDETDT